MTPTNTLYLATIAADALQPAIIDEVSDKEMYIGYCSPDCQSFSEPKWLIKHIYTDNDGQKIFISNGSRKMNVAWTDRRNLFYAPNTAWSKPEKPQLYDDFGNPIPNYNY